MSQRESVMSLIPEYELGLWNAWIFMVPSLVLLLLYFPTIGIRHHMVLCGSSNNTNRTSWKLSSLSELGYHSSRKTSYQRHLSVFKTSYVCNYVFGTFRYRHSFSFLGFLVVRYHNRSRSNSSIFRED